MMLKLSCRLSMRFHISPIAQKLQITPQALQRFHTAMPQIRESVPSEVKAGYGEYIVFHQTESGKKSVQKDIYDKVFEVLKQSLPHMNGAATLSGEMRYNQIRNRVKAISADLEIAFIPRTLHELFFLRKCVEEDLERGSICLNLSPVVRNRPGLEKIKGCWHKCFVETNPLGQEKKIRKVSRNLNNALLAELPKENSFAAIRKMLEEQLSFFRQLHTTSGSDLSNKAIKLANCSMPGPTTNFVTESTRGAINPMGISNEAQVNIVRNAVALECSKVAEKCLLVYRGGNLEQDLPWQFGKPYSLSYGTSLFAGALYDGGATAFRFMRDKRREAYAIPIPFEELDSVVHIPKGSIVEQLSSSGEWFHARSKIWQLKSDDQIGGIFGLLSSLYQKWPQNLKSSATAFQFVEKFNAFNGRAISLKS